MRLAIDTSTLTLSLAVEASGTVVATRSTYLRAGHSRILTGEVEAILDALDAAPHELTEVIVGLGPGSFTGLRIGLAFARGLGRSLEIPVIGRLSFAGFAALLPPGRRVACAIDARKREVYGGIWTTGRAARRLVPETTWAPAQFASLCNARSAHSSELVLCGGGFLAYPDAFAELVARRGEIPPQRRAPRAEGLLTWIPYPAKPTGPVEPLYIRPSEAEVGRGALALQHDERSRGAQREG